MSIDLRCGDWRDVLADVGEVDAVITDPPYSERTHNGQRTGSSIRMPSIGYGHITSGDARALADAWAPRCRWYAVVFGDHVTSLWHREAWGLYGFDVYAPVGWVKTNPPPCFNGMGPASALEHVTIARRRRRLPPGRRFSRPGVYLVDAGGDSRTRTVSGAKSLQGMRAIVGDYTNPGDVVVDPYAGGGTTLIAAAELGCKAIGAELDPDTYAKAQKRIARGYTPLPHPRAHKSKGKPKQGALW
jgi:site-specific DNA-methyltransferase (adenine-specific)